ncbi:aminotransferase class I/II-fold pyridoxal phosphate-dependent enzyme [Streptomyces sp. ISL-98]|uniref:aminotransferase class I/II-fold pyridoxal phosphate-dependent enzyme n=1 Tax=Streptomyces sp. ISL-98 TaxID=2819192 RepID=UPI001BE9F489|nr:aminotransferase class I/II-fold pyridoxal phosphate-dependent enzyme [Streptomyces sp. ISL-98]MBT2510381.1 aminotransferase class I/II-fold pyridoxal phosphate-dependent enzyme [Streptomyces sp. ISL-98]
MAAYIILVACATSLYMTFPGARTSLWALIGVGGAAALLTGVQLNRPAHRWPWWVLAAALLAFAAGDTYYNVLEEYFHESNPFPSPADALYLTTYPLFAAGLLGLVRYRWVGRDLPSLLDALIFTGGLALPVWVYLVQPLTQIEGLTWEQRAISIAYPLGDVLVLALLVRLITPGTLSGPNRALQLLVLGTITLLGFDIAYGILQLNGTWQAGTLLDTGWIVFYTAWGLAGLHPSMAALTARTHQTQSLIPQPHRLVLLAAATLIAPAILLHEAVRGNVGDAAVIAAFSGALFLLVMLRLAGMMVAQRKAVAREQALRTAAASLVAAIRPQEIERSCDAAVSALFGPKVRHGTMLLSAARAEDLYAVRSPPSAAIGDRRVADAEGGTPPGGDTASALRRTNLVPVAELGPGVAAEFGDLPSALVCPMIQPDRPAGGEMPGVLLAAGPEKQLDETRGSLEILASHAGLAMERVALRQEISRRESQAYFRTLVGNASDVILIVEDDNTVRYASPSAEAVFGSVRLSGAELPELVDLRDRDRATRMLTAVREGEQQDPHDHWWVPRDNGRIEVEVRCSDLRQDRTVRGLVVTLRDVTEQRRLEHELTQRAFHDSLTGLPNRTLLLERIERALLRGRRESTVTCVLFIDLDDFKVVNDTMGHTVGDQLLAAVGGRLSGALRRSDTAARLGGDEFAVLMEDAKAPIDAEILAAQVVQTLNRPFRLPDGAVSVSASVGVATAMDSSDTGELLRHADLALYAAKSAGKHQWRRFQPRLHARMVERHDLLASLDKAIADEEFTLRYQPVVDIAAGDVVGFEALTRWPHAQRGLVPPDQFIALAEETGHITPLGAWVLGNATADIAGLQRATPRSTPPYVSVNVSARQFQDTGFLDKVSRALEASGLAPGCLQLELTESVLMRRDGQIQGVMHSLKDVGVRIAVDDFGTGFSSLGYLREFPIDVLKIDKTFIDDIALDTQQVALVEGIVRIADTLGLQVIAEGIEDSAQRDLLAGMGCRFGQGYLFARPMTVEQGEFLLRHRDGAWLSPSAQDSGAPTQARAGIGPEGGAGGSRAAIKGRAIAPKENVMREAATPPLEVRHDQRWGDLEHLRRTSPMSDAVLDEVRGRHIRSGDHWLIDFASCNYLGFDCDPEIIDAIEPAVRKWGTHPSWSRLLGSPRLYPEIEERLAALLGAPDTLLLPTATLIHASVIPVLTGKGHVFVEAAAHRTVYDGCVSARGQGATMQRFRADRPEQLDSMLRAVPPGSVRLVCLDGVNSMTGNIPDLPELAGICRDRNATLYIDDTHGFGVIGERRADELCPYGCRGNSVVRHTGETYDDIVLVGGFSKAYSSLLAFLALPTWLKDHLKVAAAPYLYSGPSPTASLATTLAGLEVNDRRGDPIRADLYRKTVRLLDHVHGLGLDTLNTDRLPIVEIPLQDASDLSAVAGFLWDHGIYVTLAAYPLVPHDRVGFRIQITALNSDEDIDQLNDTLTRLSERFALRPGR